MHKGYSTLIHNTDARAYMVYNEAGKRLAICPYGNGTEDASEDEARKCAMQAYSYLNGTGRDRYYILPCFDEDGKKDYAVYDSAAHVEVAYAETISSAQKILKRMNDSWREEIGKPLPQDGKGGNYDRA